MTAERLRLAFAGTPEPAAIVLQRLLQAPGSTPAVVYTQPDRPAGRGRKLRASPVKQLALEYQLSVHQPETAAALATDTDLAACDLMIVVAYGMLLPEVVLARPRLGCINLHFSLLPRWRGAAPVQRAILAGDTETGISVMQMDAGLDTGPILVQRSCPIGTAATAGELLQQLARLGAECLIEVLPALAAGTITARPQNPAGVSYARKISKLEARLDWQQPATQLARTVHAFNPYPVAHARLADLDCRIWTAEALSQPPAAGARPGAVVGAGKQGIDVACGDGLLRIQQLQLAGGRPLSAAEFLNGRPDFAHGHHPR